MTQHIHRDAFMVMTYMANDRDGFETIWNSRDGVTPFAIALTDGRSAIHRNWGSDRYEPDFKPPLGSRVFIDMTEERAAELAMRNAAHFWDDVRLPASEDGRWATVEELALDLERSYLQEVERGAPDLVEVTQEMAQQRGWL